MSKKQNARDEIAAKVTSAIRMMPGYEEMSVKIDSTFSHPRGVAFTDNLVRVTPLKFDSMLADTRLGDNPKSRTLSIALYLMTRYNERHEHDERQRRLNVLFAREQMKEAIAAILKDGTDLEFSEFVNMTNELLD